MNFYSILDEIKIEKDISIIVYCRTRNIVSFEHMKRLNYYFKAIHEQGNILICWYDETFIENRELSSKEIDSIYTKFVRNFVKNYGYIYLENENNKIALQYADVFCTDSILEDYLWQISKKKHFFINVTEFDSISAETFLDDGDYFWITADKEYSNKLIKISKFDWSTEIKISPIKDKITNRNFSSLLKYNNKIYLIPDFATYMLVYDIKGSNWEYVEIKPEIGCKRKFSTGIVYDKYLYLFPRNYSCVVRYHLAEKHIEYLSESMTYLNKILKRNDSLDFCKRGRCFNNRYIFYSAAYNAILSFDFITLNIEILLYLDSNQMCSTCTISEKYMWLFCQGNKHEIIKFSLLNNTYEIINNLEKRVNYKRIPFYCSCEANGYLFLLPGLADYSLKMNIETNEIEILQEFTSSEWRKSNAESWRYVFVENAGDMVYAFDGELNELVEYCCKDNRSRRVTLKVTEENYICEKVRNYFQFNVFENPRIKKTEIYYE